jgi:L-asparaginase II
MMARIEAACEKRGVGVKAYVNKLATQEQVLARMADIAKRNSSGLDDGDDLMDELMG